MEILVQILDIISLAAESWSWGLKLVWFLVKIVTHLEYECCEVQPGPPARLLTRWPHILTYLKFMYAA